MTKIHKNTCDPDLKVFYEEHSTFYILCAHCIHEYYCGYNDKISPNSISLAL
jgi:hypothetical protein